jgi:hypothetical protein
VTVPDGGDTTSVLGATAVLIAATQLLAEATDGDELAALDAIKARADALLLDLVRAPT